MLYIAYFIIVSGHNIKIFFAKFSIFDLWRVENCCAHTPNAIEPPTNSSFEAFGGPMDRARWAQWPLRGPSWALKYSYCHQMITQSHPRGNRFQKKSKCEKSSSVTKQPTQQQFWGFRRAHGTG